MLVKIIPLRFLKLILIKDLFNSIFDNWDIDLRFTHKNLRGLERREAWKPLLLNSRQIPHFADLPTNVATFATLDRLGRSSHMLRMNDACRKLWAERLPMLLLEILLLIIFLLRLYLRVKSVKQHLIPIPFRLFHIVPRNIIFRLKAPVNLRTKPVNMIGHFWVPLGPFSHNPLLIHFSNG